VSEAQWKIFKFRKAATSSVVAIVVVVGARGRVKGKKQVKEYFKYVSIIKFILVCHSCCCSVCGYFRAKDL